MPINICNFTSTKVGTKMIYDMEKGSMSGAMGTCMMANGRIT